MNIEKNSNTNANKLMQLLMRFIIEIRVLHFVTEEPKTDPKPAPAVPKIRPNRSSVFFGSVPKFWFG